MAEEATKNLFVKKIREVGYPTNADKPENGIVWYKEDSYKVHDKKLAAKFAKASKSLTGKTDGRPDFTIDTDKGWILVVECKDNVAHHQSYDTLIEYKGGIGDKADVQKYAINGALHYATYVNDDKDVIAIAVSGVKESNLRITSFVLPMNGKISDVELIEDGEYDNTVMSIDDYIKIANIKLGRNKAESERVFSELSSYAQVTANYLRANKISAKDRAGFISAIILALTNEDSMLYKNAKVAIDAKNASKSKTLTDTIGESAITLLKNSLYDIWDNKDRIPKVKRDALEEYYNGILVKSLLNEPDGLEKCKRYYKYGDNVLSCCIYSVYENITTTLQHHTDLDIMGTFYTVFLRYAAGDAKDKGIVLTPKHITELFCDIAEHYLGKKLDQSTKVIDIACGTGAFLIAALNKMDSNINKATISEAKKKKYRKDVRTNCLIGVENEPSMFALAYANMRFHGDGKSNLYCCSSLLKDKDSKGVVDKDEEGHNISLMDQLKNKSGNIDVAMVNPPYSTDSPTDKKKGEKQSGQTELDFVYSMLTYLKKGGIGIAIVPMSCASNKGKGMRETILKEHTLLACMTMPPKLFQDSKVGTSTCIMVFKAHIPHKDTDKIVFMSRWLDDGFVTVPHNGRFDKNNQWTEIKAEWLRQIKGISKSDDTVFLKRIIKTGKEECLAEAYVETDYSKLTDDDFERTLKKYALFLYMQENDLSEE